MADNFRLDGKVESGNVAVSVTTEESPRYSFTGKFTFPSLDVGKSIAGDEYYFSGNIENDRLDVAEEEVSDSRFEFGIELHRKTLVVMGSADTGDGYEFSVDFGGPQVDLTRYYTKEEIDLLLREKADKANTLAGFNIRDAYISEDTIHLGTSAIKIPQESGGGGTGGDSFFELVDENGTKSVRLKEEYAGLWTTGFLSVRGKDDSGSAGGGGSSLSDIWASLNTNTDAFRDVKINSGHIPELSIDKIAGLQDELDNKLGTSSFSSSQWAAINSTITEEKLTAIEKITALFGIDSDGNVYVTGNRGLYSNSFISARGKDGSGSAGGGSADLQSVWTSLSTATDAFKGVRIDSAHIPSLGIGKIAGLQDALDGKLGTDDLTTAQWAAINSGVTDVMLSGLQTSVSTLESGLAAEITRAKAKEDATAADLTAETTRAMRAETQLDANIVAETDRAKAAEAALSGITDTLSAKLSGIEAGAQVNVIESVKLNGTALAVSGKAVNVNAATSIGVPTGLSAGSLTSGGKITLSLTSGYTIPKESRLSDIEKITALFGIDADGNVYVTGSRGLYSNAFVSARGKDASGGTGGGGSSLEDVWTSLAGNTDAYKDTKINLGHIPAIGMDKVTGLSAALLGKADRGTTLAAYGIGDAYTADETDVLLSGKSDTGHKHSAGDITSGALALDRIPTIPYSKTSGVQAALVSGTSIKTINGVSLLGSGNIVTPNTTYSSKAAASGGTDLSLVTTGEKYTWNAKQAAISDLATIRSNASNGATAYGWGDHSKAGYLKSIANLTINGTLYDGTNAVTINTPTYTLASFGITASAAELNYTKGVTSAIQTQLNAKASSSHTHTFASLTSKPTTLAGYGITDALGSKVLFSKQDYQRYVLLLCRIGANTSNQTHTIDGTFWTEAGGGNRYQAAYINLHCADWTSRHNEYYGFTPFGMGTVPRLVTCTYNSSQYLAVTFENVPAIRVHFDGSSYNILFTPVLYYTSNTQTVNNSEIYNSIADVQYDKIPMIPSANTVYHTGNLTKSSIDLGNVENTAFYKRGASVNGTVWDMAGTVNSSAFSIYAPTSAGTSGQVLCSTGGTPSWVNPTALTTGAANALASNRYPTSNTNNAAPLIWFTGQPAIDTAEGNAYKGSSNNYNLWSYPAGGTCETTTYANIQTLRLSWNKSKYWHDIFASPNGTYLWHRNVQNGTANDWHRIVEETTSNGWDISITGKVNAFRSTAAPVKSWIPTSAGWYRVAKVTMDGVDVVGNYSRYPNLTIKILGMWNATACSNALLTFQSRHTRAMFTQLSGNIENIDKIRAVQTENTSIVEYYIDIYVRVAGSACSVVFEGLGKVTPADTPTLITDTVTAAHELGLGMIYGTNITDFNIKNYALPLTGGTLTGALSVPEITMPGSGGRSMEYSGNGILFKTYNDGWAVDFAVVSTSGKTIGAIAGAYGNADTLKYYYFGGLYNSPLMAITSGGNVGIGTTSPSNKLHVVGTAYASTGMYSDGFVSARGVDSSSDERLKTDIRPLENALQYVLGTKYRSFRWKEDGKPCIGVIAQEELGREHGYLVEKHREHYSYNYAATTALIGAALQEEDRKVEALKKKIAELENEVRRLRNNNS